jgi:hypothetical protein
MIDQETQDEMNPIYRDADRLDPQGSRCRCEGQRPVPQARDFGRHVLQLEVEVRRPIGRSRRQRKQAEMLFAHMKRILKVDRLRLRGISGARDEFLLTETAQNLRRMAKILGTGPPGNREMAVT